MTFSPHIACWYPDVKSTVVPVGEAVVDSAVVTVVLVLVAVAIVSASPLWAVESLPQLAATTEMKASDATIRERRSWRRWLVMQRTVPEPPPGFLRVDVQETFRTSNRRVLTLLRLTSQLTQIVSMVSIGS